MSPDAPSSKLAEWSGHFAEEVGDTLAGVLPDAPRVVSREFQNRYVVRPHGDTARRQRVPLYVGGEHLASLSLALYLDLDRYGTYLKTVRSDVAVYSELDDTPLVRLEYRADMRRDPISHWQVHAERGAFSHVLARAHAQRPRVVPKPHDLSSVHLPVGGERFRPCLEDVLQLLVVDCGVDHVEGWEAVVRDGRERWRRRQLAAAVRDVPDLAARVLRDLGWTVQPPADAPAGAGAPSMRAW